MNMTNEQAIENIEILKAFLSYPKDDNSNVLNALDLAIKALEEKKKRDEMITKYKTQSGMVELGGGEWVTFSDIKQALRHEQKRLTLIEDFTEQMAKYEYASELHRYWSDLVDALKDCEVE